LQEAAVKDELLVILDAVQMARAQMRAHYEGGWRDQARTIERLKEILLDDKVSSALGLLAPNIEAPGLQPDDSVTTSFRVPELEE
jgi:hypothetical protein